MGTRALANAIVLVTPPTGAAWLANKIAPHDEQLNAGDGLLAGNFSQLNGAVADDNFNLDEGLLGTVSLRLVCI